jgi:hypothetical protein
MNVNIPPTTTATTRWWCGDLRHQNSKQKAKQEAIIRTFRIFDDGLRLGDVQTPLIHIKETVSFELDKVTGIF